MKSGLFVMFFGCLPLSRSLTFATKMSLSNVAAPGSGNLIGHPGSPGGRGAGGHTAFDAGPHWSPDGKKIVFGRTESAGLQQLWVMDLENLDPLGFPVATQITFGPDTKLFGNWGEIKDRWR